jgi:hypothetical protein
MRGELVQRLMALLALLELVRTMVTELERNCAELKTELTRASDAIRALPGEPAEAVARSQGVAFCDQEFNNLSAPMTARRRRASARSTRIPRIISHWPLRLVRSRIA